MSKHTIPVVCLKKQKILHLTWSLLPLRSVVSWLLAPSARISSSDSTSLLLLELWAWANSLCRVALCPWVAATAMALQTYTLFIQTCPTRFSRKNLWCRTSFQCLCPKDYKFIITHCSNPFCTLFLLVHSLTTFQSFRLYHIYIVKYVEYI